MSGKRFAMNQSNYMSWKGYFDLIRASDVFVICDEVQYTKQDWRNRNVIKTKDGPKWLVIPVTCPEGKPGNIEDQVPADPRWPRKHWKTIQVAYAKAPYFKEYAPTLEELYGGAEGLTLSQVNERFIRGLCGLLGIKTEIRRSDGMNLPTERNQRIIEAAKKLGAKTYISGPAAKVYLERDRFDREGIDVVFADYGGYPEYAQPHPPFVHSVSVIDLLFSEGPNALKFMKAVA